MAIFIYFLYLDGSGNLAQKLLEESWHMEDMPQNVLSMVLQLKTIDLKS